MVWLCVVALILENQAFWLVRKQQLAIKRRALPEVWLGYAAFVAACAVIILVGYGIALPPTAAWVLLWYPSLIVMAWSIWFHRKNAPRGGTSACTAAGDAAPADAAAKASPCLDIKAKASEGMTAITIEQPKSPVIAAHRPQPVAEAVETVAGPDATPAVHPHLGQRAAARAGDDGQGQPRRQRRAALRRAAIAAAKAAAWSSMLWVILLASFLAIQVTAGPVCGFRRSDTAAAVPSPLLLL